MKAIKTDLGISIQKRIPKNLTIDGTTICNFNTLSDEELKAYGYYDIVTPSYDSISQRLGQIEWDEENEVFTYPVVDIDFDATYEAMDEETMELTGEVLPVYDLAIKKSSLVSQAKSQANLLLSSTDWMVIRKAERGIDIPAETLEARNTIITRVDEIETEIDQLSSYEDALRYTFNII